VSGARWAVSTLDFKTHILELPAGDHPPDVLKARCGHYLRAAVATLHAEPPLSGRCPQCQLISPSSPMPRADSRDRPEAVRRCPLDPRPAVG
jgi:hypothetical protein